jgi:acetylornithine deacetylase/succinyl-diaminopimelate desuccinylase-like protein
VDRDGALAALEANFDRTLDALVGLTRIPSVSAPGFDPAEVARSADGVAVALEAAGLERVEVLHFPEAHPYVVAEWLGAGEDAPTALFYAHHDVQPPGRVEHWRSPPFEPTLRDDGRLYARGIVDDKAGLFVHLAAMRAWLETAGRLPLNVKWIVEGEEEIGSPHLQGFLEQQRERLDADVIVLSDTANAATGVPALTTSLRGLVNVDVRVRALDHPLHSGLWGGALPDAATALSRLLARLVDDRGEIAVPGLGDDVPEPSAEDRTALARVPWDEPAFRRDSGLRPDAPLVGDPGASVWERLWLRPALAVTALEAVPLAEAANQLVAEARARVGVRLAPGQDPARVRDLLTAFLERDPPLGVEVATHVEAISPGWRTEARGPAFDAARRALAAGFGVDAVDIGCGGTIPFVGPFSNAFGGAPALLLGLEDPACNAHGENESLHLGDFRKAARACVHLLPELSRGS